MINLYPNLDVILIKPCKINTGIQKVSQQKVEFEDKLYQVAYENYQKETEKIASAPIDVIFNPFDEAINDSIPNQVYYASNIKYKISTVLIPYIPSQIIDSIQSYTI